MSKRKLQTKLPDVSIQSYELIKAGTKVYPDFIKDPITKKWNWYVCYEEKGKVTRFNKPVNSADLNEAIHKSIIYLHKNLK